ncbi:NADH:ubiquinone oxidoreductase, NADH-binding (51 kD) subunit [Halobacteroides halobius DSM 5150]|uniref:NADH:ubiquinone oxidoreductase, NADH-binding (51 kD) subunit n=1 Tax=Halobacteroides halobius (strain ATCC 35273 / DSM 5150 / MD-1) TaxID=748449 RepID=L0K5U6_HALHC|nr:NADH-ubiquinone oxidoreductase-F iron-sulfur binding region domain-containing protein [Halobacteroides halobius]AGB40371.1 NADH:ubiquinone oxidoreductase, NADH-binding (51 kD) subunit [Halobacteroides halobius DSM 5150]
MEAKNKILVCAGTSCDSSEGPEIYRELLEKLQENGLDDKTRVVETGCFGFCDQGPIVVVYSEESKDGIFYCQVKSEDAEQIVKEHLIKGRIIDDLLYVNPKTEEKVPEYKDIDFYEYQQRIALRNCGQIDPFEIADYKANDGYKSLDKVLNQMTPEEVIQEVKESKLRGRGGGGFPTGVKWELTAKSEETPKYIICNADEGDPGAFMDRSILEGDPYSVIEGMTIGAYAIGANQGFVYVRAEYPLAVERLQGAIENARAAGMLGADIFGSGFDFDVEIKIGAGAFVCGEETALITSVEGYRGDPQSKPPYPAQNGLYDQPTLINNVETLANIPIIIHNGGDWYNKIGTEDSAGTKVFALAGDINNTGLIEVPMGTSLREVIFDLGGGIPEGKEVKAAQTGGPSGGFIPQDNLDISLEYDALLEANSMMGSGGLIILDETSCMVDVARFYLDFTQDEACGKCAPGRIGTKRMLEVLNKIVEGDGSKDDLDLLERLATDIKDTALCGLCKSAPNPVLSTLEHFRDEYLAHTEDKYCPAGICDELAKYEIDPEICVSCGKCAEVCPVDAISGEDGEAYVIDPEICISCGKCAEECPVDAISKG